MNRNLTSIALFVSVLVSSQTQCVAFEKAIEKHDVKTIQWLVLHAHSSNLNLTQEQKDAYLELAKEQVERCSLAHETRSVISILSELPELEWYSIVGGLTLTVGGIWSGVHSGIGLWKHNDAEWKKEWKGIPSLFLGVGATVKGLRDIVETFKGHKTNKDLENAKLVQEYLALLPTVA